MAKRPHEPLMVNVDQFDSLADAVEKIQLDRPFDRLAHEILTTYIDSGGRSTLLAFFFMSAVTRARGLREGAVREIEAACSPSAATLLRQLAESVALTFYVGDEPAYAEAIAFPADQARPGAPKRKGPQALIHHMDRHHAGHFGIVYSDLNDMTHFNSSAMWSSHRIGTNGSSHWSSTPGWKNDLDPLIYCALLLELTSGMKSALVHLGTALVRTIHHSRDHEHWVTQPLG